MTLNNISLASYITGLLRQNITDPNSVNRASQFGQWVYSDKPKIMKLLNDKNNFPRISCETISNNTVGDMGMECSEQLESYPLKINVWTVRDLLCDIQSTISEDHTYVSGTDIYELTNLPTSKISLVLGTLVTVPAHTFVKGTDYNLVDSDSDGFYDSIEWLGAPGDKPDDGTDFYVSYQRSASADELCRFIAQEINQYLRTWRTWPERIVWSYRKTGGTPVDFDNEHGVYKYELTCSFEGINIGDSI